jgi:hypothetical protein
VGVKVLLRRWFWGRHSSAGPFKGEKGGLESDLHSEEQEVRRREGFTDLIYKEISKVIWYVKRHRLFLQESLYY